MPEPTKPDPPAPPPIPRRSLIGKLIESMRLLEMDGGDTSLPAPLRARMLRKAHSIWRLLRGDRE